MVSEKVVFERGMVFHQGSCIGINQQQPYYVVEHWTKCHLTLIICTLKKNVTLHSLYRVHWKKCHLTLIWVTLEKMSPYTHDKWKLAHWTKGHLTKIIWQNTGQNVTLHSQGGTLEKMSPYICYNYGGTGTLEKMLPYRYTHYSMEHWTKGHLTLIIIIQWNTGHLVTLQLHSLYSGTLDKRSSCTRNTVEHWTKCQLTQLQGPP